MKKLITILFLFGIAYGQLPLDRGPIGIHERDARVQGYRNLVIPVYSDTTEANLWKGLDSLGAFIQIRSTGLVYHRDTSAATHKWSLFSGTTYTGDEVGIHLNGTQFSIIAPSGNLIVGNASGVGVPVAMGGDALLGNNGLLTLNNVNADSYGSNTFLKVSVNAKGQVTSATPVVQSDILPFLPYLYAKNGLHLRDDTTLVLGGTLDTTQTTITSDASHLFRINFGSDAGYDLIYRDSTTNFWKRLAKGTVGQSLQMLGAGGIGWANQSAGGSSNPFADNTALVKNNSDNTKLLLLSAASITTGTTRTWTFPDVNGTVARNDAAQTFTGIQTFSSSPVIPTASASDNSTKAASTAYVDAADNLKANLASPTFTGTPSLPTGTTGVTQTANDNSTKLATTAYVDANTGPKLIASGTFSNQATASINLSAFYNLYTEYEINLYNIVTASANTTVEMRLSSDGTTFDATAAHYNYADFYINTSGGTGTAGASTGADNIFIYNASGTTTSYNAGATINIYGPNVNTYFTKISHRATFDANGGGLATILGGASWLSANYCKGVRFLCAAGNISFGYKIYGK